MNKSLSSLVTQLVASPHEHELVEFKHNYHSAEEIGEDLSALANSANLRDIEYAYLVFGVEDTTHNIIGTNFEPYKKKAKGNEDLIPWLSRLLNPKLAFSVDEVTMESGARVVVFTVPAALNNPVTFQNIAYIRVGSYTKKLSDYPEEQAKIWRKQATDWSAAICEGATISDLAPEALARARELFTIKNPKLAESIPTWDDVTFLNKAKLSIQGKLTRTAILLLGKPESDHFLSPANATITWILKDAHNLEKDYEHFGLPWLLAVDAVYAKVRNLKYRYIPDGSLFPDEVDQYDPYILREALHKHKQAAFEKLCADEKIQPEQLQKLLQTYEFASRLPRPQEIKDALSYQPKVLERKTILGRVAEKIENFITTFIEGRHQD